MRHETIPDGEEYVDFSVNSDTTDNDSDSHGTNSSSDDGFDDPLNENDDSDHINANTNTNDDEHGRTLTRPEIVQSQEELWVEPTVVHYPGSRAGEVCSEGIAAMQAYENALGGPSENPYSPFGSQIDWEIAKWAKLRGPSATSFTELLNISGVSVVSRLPIFVASPPLSSCTNS